MGGGFAPFPPQRGGKLSESIAAGAAVRSGCFFGRAFSGCPVCLDHHIRVACQPRTGHESGARIFHRRARSSCVNDRYVRPPFPAVLLLPARLGTRSDDNYVLEESGCFDGVRLRARWAPLADGATAGAGSRRPNFVYAVRCGLQARHMVWSMPSSLKRPKRG